jgi:hypothetical protein
VEFVQKKVQKTREISKKRLTSAEIADELSGQRSELSSRSDNNLLNSRQTKLLKILKRAPKRRMRAVSSEPTREARRVNRLRRADQARKGMDG